MNAHQDKQSNALPISLLIGGLLGALYYVFLAFTEPQSEFVIQFAIACLVSVIGWQEMRATDGGESGESSGF